MDLILIHLGTHGNVYVKKVLLSSFHYCLIPLADLVM